MSQYIEFFVKSKNNDFTCIESFSRNSAVYEFFNGPYGKLRKLTIERGLEVKDLVLERQNTIQNNKKEIQEKITRIGTFNNSVQEKIEAINEYYDILDEINYEMDGLTYVIKFIEVLLGIVNNMSYEANDVGIYYGVEVGLDPTIEDVVE